MGTILHITKRSDWELASQKGAYTASSLEQHGFIHCSTAEQVIPVANFLFRGQNDLVLLCINEALLEATVKYENLEGGTKLFPHVYGPIGLNTVIEVIDFPPSSDGTFKLPAKVSSLKPGRAS